MPWTLVSRDPNGYSAQLTADVLPCDGYSKTVNVDRNDGQTVRVVVWRPIGPPCGRTIAVPMRLQAATVTASLPATLMHAATNLSIEMPTDPPVPPATAVPSGMLKLLGPSDNGSTIVVPVGSAVTVMGSIAGLPGSGQRNPVTSTNPSVPGPADPTQPVGAFRAWKTGTTDLNAPGTHPWVVHVIVR